MSTWLYDKKRNRASVEKWGSVEEAERSLKTLKKCKYCTDCIDCTNCIECTDCTDCIGCTECRRCKECYECIESSNCTECTNCAKCKSCTWCCLCLCCFNCSFCHYNDDCYTRNNNYADQYGSVIPIVNNIHRKVYAAASERSALNMSEWHCCKTTHCRAGWVVTLAGKAGAELESKISTLFAAFLIYKISDPVNRVSILRFYDSNENAIADMKRLADLETASIG